MNKINFEDLPSTNTPINSANLNQLQDNIENEFNNYINNNLTTIVDCNDTTLSSGFYYAGSSTLNIPTASAWFLQVMKKADNNIIQVAYRYRDNEIYTRHYNIVEPIGWKEWVQLDVDNSYEITTGQESATNEWIDGRQVFRKRIDCGNLQASGLKKVNHGISYREVIKLEGMACGGGYYHPLPYVSVAGMGNISEYSMCIAIDSSVIYIAVGRDRSDMTAKVDVYYTKNN